MRKLLLMAAMVAIGSYAVPTFVFASSTNGTIDAVNRYAWSENAGWIDFGTSEGNVHVTASGLSGYAWGENIGWISLNCSNDISCDHVQYGVVNDGNGNLSGYAWSENAGWINFAPAGGGVTISASGVFSGYAWGENIGWIVFNCATTNSCTVNYEVSTDWRPSAPAPSGGGGAVSTGGGGSAYDLAIDNDTPTTATPNVTLSLYGTAAYTMEISNTPDFSSSTWIPYVTSLPWMLATTQGTATVYVEYRSISGSVIGSAEASIGLTPFSTGAASSLPTVTVPSSTAGMSISQLQALLASLEAQLRALEAQASGSTPATTSSSSSSFTFTRDLALWDTGSDVTDLQQFLIQQNIGPAAQALERHGVTRTFGLLTYHALVEFQTSVGITPAKGYFGPKTRAWVNSH